MAKKKAKAKRRWAELKTVDVSTAHITQEDGRLLDEIYRNGLGKFAEYALCMGADEYGGWFCTNRELTAAITIWSKHLVRVLKTARTDGYHYVRFDRDASPCDFLPEFEW